MSIGSLYSLLAVGFFCGLQFFVRFLPLLDLSSGGKYPDGGSTSRPAARLPTSFPSCNAFCNSRRWSLARFSWKAGPRPTGFDEPYSIAFSSAFKRRLSFTSIWATSRRNRFLLSLFAQPACTTSAWFILGPHFGEKARASLAMRLLS